jgi:hypothetical protein
MNATNFRHGQTAGVDRRITKGRSMLTMRWPLQSPGEDWRRRYRLRAHEVQAVWADYLARLPWQLFVTLTFDPTKVFPVDQNRASREAFAWCNDAARIYRRPLGWVYAPERGKSGQWHAHALIIGAPFEGGEPSQLPEAAGMWTARNGDIDVRRVFAVEGITLYTTKQAAEAGDLVWSDTLGRYRHGLRPSPTVNLF